MENQGIGPPERRISSISVLPSIPLGPHLPFLPPEVLRNITNHLSRSDAISFALSSRAFFSAAEARIYRELDVSLHPYFGVYPVIGPFAYGEAGYDEWANQEDIRAEDRHRLALREKIKRIMLEADAAKTARVRTVKITPRTGAINGIIQLLDLVSPHVRTLEVHPTRVAALDPSRRTKPYHCLDMKMIEAGIFFPSLTHLKIEDNAIWYAEFVHLLCLSARNLESLDVDIDHFLESQDWEASELVPSFPLLTEATKIRRLRLRFGNLDNSQGVSVAHHPILDLIELSPRLSQVIVQYQPAGSYLLDRLFSVLGRLRELEDLYWYGWPHPINEICHRVPGTFASLRRLVLMDTSHGMLFTSLPRLPALQEIYIIPLEPHPTSHYIPPTSQPSMIPSFAQGLRLCPKLRAIQGLPCEIEDDPEIFSTLDRLAAAGSLKGFVRSFRHHDEEVLHAHLHLDHYQTHDIPHDPLPHDTLPHDHHPTRPQGFHAKITYIARDGSLRDKMFQCGTVSMDIQQDYLDYDGMVVPLRILEEMRVVQGAGKDEWRGRGIEIGDEAWAVLQEWHKSVGGISKSEYDNSMDS